MDSNKDTGLSPLLNSAIKDAQTLVRAQVELAKAEVSQSAKAAVSASMLFIGAALLAFLAFVFALVAGAYGLVAAGLPVWAGFLIVTGVLILVAVVLGLVGRSRVNQVGPPKRAIAEAQTTKAALTSITSSATPHEQPGTTVVPATSSPVPSTAP
ncbi:MAG: phage holin family protein [Candidatus Nanopelagicales bacterium]